MEALTEIDLPEYSPSIPPDYSSTPLPGEQCIQRTPKQSDRSRENCAFTYEEHGMSLTLRGCREEEGIPTFGLCSTIYGEFAPANREKVISVAVTLQAQIRVKLKSGALFHTLFSKERLVWQRNDSTDMCPSLLPISISFPSTYRDKGRGHSRRLPPSMSISEPCRMTIVYSLNILVRKATGAFFSRTKEVSLSAYLRYRPRVRPPRPSPPSFSSLKICPEEWQEEIWGVTSSPSSNKGNESVVAQCHLFVPSVRVFSPSETVPFHISFCSSTPFLDSIAEPARQSDVACPENPIHVFLLRRTTVTIRDWKDVQEEVLGVGRVSPSPMMAIEPTTENPTSLSWDGEIQCERPIEYSSFTTSEIEVRDFLVLSLLAPPGPLKSIPPQLYQTFPIRLATHPCGP